MPTFNDPKADAAEAYEALRGLAHASRAFADPADTYPVLGDLLGAVRSLTQVVDQLAVAHAGNRGRAYDDTGNPLPGASAALTAAGELRNASTLLEQVHEHLDAAMSASGRIAWFPAADPPPNILPYPADPLSAEAGTLRLTVWPNPATDQQPSFTVLIEDPATGHTHQGSYMFAGPGSPTDAAGALREVAGLLAAAGHLREHGPGHPDSDPELENRFPDAITESARRNHQALSELSEIDPVEAASEPIGTVARWISVVFLQGEEADRTLDLIDTDGTDAAIEHLAGYDIGEETVQAALANGYVYDEPPVGALDHTATRDVYRLTYNAALGHVSLLRQYDATPDPGLLGIDNPTPATGREGPASVQEARAPRSGQSGPGWFGRRSATSASARGLSL